MRLNKWIGLSIVLGLGFVAVPSANAKAKVFKNCTELNKKYPGGVAMPGAINSGGATKNEPKYSKRLYKANQKSDRDKIGLIFGCRAINPMLFILTRCVWVVGTAVKSWFKYSFKYEVARIITRASSASWAF